MLKEGFLRTFWQSCERSKADCLEWDEGCSNRRGQRVQRLCGQWAAEQWHRMWLECWWGLDDVGSQVVMWSWGVIWDIMKHIEGPLWQTHECHVPLAPPAPSFLPFPVVAFPSNIQLLTLNSCQANGATVPVSMESRRKCLSIPCVLTLGLTETTLSRGAT